MKLKILSITKKTPRKMIKCGTVSSAWQRGVRDRLLSLVLFSTRDETRQQFLSRFTIKTGTIFSSPWEFWDSTETRRGVPVRIGAIKFLEIFIWRNETF
jgi:hypothetical protein